MIALGLHSHFSLMQALPSPDALCRAARQAGYSALALTDCNNLYGLWPFLSACEEHGMTPIIGAEAHTRTQRLFCLVKDRTGYRNLCRLLTARHCDPDFDLADALNTCHQGLILLAADQGLLRHCREIGGRRGRRPDRRGGSAQQRPAAHGPRAGSSRRGRAGQLFFSPPRNFPAYRLLRAIDNNCSLCRLPASETVTVAAALPSAAAWADRFQLWPECVLAVRQIAERCAFRTPYAGLVMPPWKQGDPDRELRRAAFAGARIRYGAELPAAVVSRLEHELAVIAAMNFSSYFLVVRDIVGPVARTCGRGSGAASLAAYCLHITNVCPIRHNLYFERFLNPGRTDPPDIDIDFAWDERDRLLASVLERFGRQAAMVANHVTLQPRMAIRETAKVFGVPGGEISRISKKTALDLAGGRGGGRLSRADAGSAAAAGRGLLRPLG